MLYITIKTKETQIKFCFQTAWIGLYDGTDSWRWSLSDRSFYKDGETEFSNWKTGEPNTGHSGRYCTLINSDGKWNDQNCEARFKAVCFDVKGENIKE